jgi:hypothetical protein
MNGVLGGADAVAGAGGGWGLGSTAIGSTAAVPPGATGALGAVGVGVGATVAGGLGDEA